MKTSKMLYILSGLVFLIITLGMFVVYFESSETQNNTPKIQNDVSEIESKPVEFVEKTGTPVDNYPPSERDSHCGKLDVKSTQYIQEFKIPTPCTQPLAIITDSDDNVWFVQSNTGNVAMFNPESKEFTEYQNDKWKLKRVSMVWGITYTEDNEIWFTDETNDFLWKFSINDKQYSKFGMPEDMGNSFPQKIEYYDGNFLINDFTGNRILIINHNDLDNNITTYSPITTPEGFFTSQTSVDSDGNVWFVMWKYQKETTMIKANYDTHEIKKYLLTANIAAPNGVTVGPLDNVWIADTASSSFFKFNPDNLLVTEFVTSDPPVWSYGNSSGLIKTPITRPYWNAFDSNGNMWFNQQTANRLAVFDPISESLIEYDIPSRNPGWADCGDFDDCGVSQNFGFTVQNEQVWFTEWAENNIGVIDTTIPLPVTLTVDEYEIEQGHQKEIFVNVTPITNQKLEIVLSGNTNSELITIKTKSESVTVSDKVVKIPVIVTIDKDAHKGDYKILLSTQLREVSISIYATIKIV